MNGDVDTLSSYPDTFPAVTGRNVVLKAIAEPGYHFVNWSGEPIWDGESTTIENPIEIKVTNALNITAYFASDSNEFTSGDKMVSITIPDGATALDGEGNPLAAVEFTTADNVPDLPEAVSIVGLPYQLGPDGTTFTPPVILTWNYDAADIPEGVTEEDLVVAYYDGDTSGWQELASIVNAETNTITAPVDHFTIFAAVVTLPLAPAAFIIDPESLNISPTEVGAGEPVAISLLVTNAGGQAGSHTVTLKINGEIEATEEINLSADVSRTVVFTTSQNEAGTYAIDINGLSGSFTVKEEAATPIAVDPSRPGEWNWRHSSGVLGAVAAAIAIPLIYRWRRRSRSRVAPPA
ncbi:MAG: hypothetical protein PHQ43_01705 [Dehalococcoidales bacterium]|nr:hypothetical protein [Dehalococcoidales bacterium]